MKTTPQLTYVAVIAVLLTPSSEAVIYTWNGTTGSWGDASKWNPSVVPNGGGADAVVNSGTITVATSRSIGELDLDDGVITSSSGRTLTLGSRLTWTGTGRLGGNMIIRANNGITISGSGTKTLGELNGGAATLINSSTATLSGGGLSVSGAFGSSLPGSEVINNGTWNLTSSASIGGSTSGNRRGTFTNNNIVNKSGSATASISVTFDNNGSVSVTGGRLLIGDGEDTNSSYSATGSGQIAFSMAREFGTGTTISGTGTVEFSSGSASVVDGANYNVTGKTLLTGDVDFDSEETINNLHLDSSSARLGGDADLSVGQMIWEHGMIASDAEITVGAIDMTSGNILRNLGDSQNTTSLIVTGNTTHGQGDLRINRRGTTFTNRGIYTIENGSDIDKGSSGGGAHGRFINEGTFQLNENGSAEIRTFFDNDDSSVDVLRGNLEIREGGNDDGVDYTVGRFGELEFDGGTREIDTFSSITGTGDVTFRSGTVTLDGSSYEIESPGETIIRGGTVNFDGTASAKETYRLRMLGGTRAGESLLLASNTFSWSGGTLASGAETSANGVILSGTLVKQLGNGGSGAGAVLTNYGNGTMSGGGSLSIAGSTSAAAGSIFYNTGSFEITDGSSIVGVSNGGTEGTTLNETTGVFTKSGASTVSDISVAFTNKGTVNANSGTLRFMTSYTQTSGNLTLAGGTVEATTTLNIQGGELNGNGNISGNTTVGPATLAPGASAGEIDMDGDLTLSSGSSLELEIGGLTKATEYDTFNVSGQLTLGGTLTVSFINGFTPPAGSSFNLWDATTTAGAFSTINLPALSGSLTWDTSLLSSAGILSVSGAGFTNYTEFSNAYSLTEGPSGDDDKDGLENFLEYLLGSIPTDGTSAPKMSVTRSGTTTTIKITVPEQLPPGVSQYIESSPSMLAGSWTQIANRPAAEMWDNQVTVSSPSGGFVEVTMIVTGSLTKNFYRLSGSEISPP
ncbi:MAG: beta strand repeat-containing protein [Akkermansiaceae bacterium]